MKNVYEFFDYKRFLGAVEQQRSYVARGFRSRLAEQLGCNSGFVSQVLNTDANFSLEQAYRISRYINLDGDEEKYFLLLVEYARAGDKELAQYFKNQLDELRVKNLNIKDRLQDQVALSAEVQSTYYSHWYFAAIHMAVTIQNYQTLSSLANGIGLPKAIVQKVVTFLLSCDLISERNGKLGAGSTQLHLDRNSPNITKHHTNWRLLAVNSLQSEEKSDVHYSTVSTFSFEDAEILKARLVQQIEDYVKTISVSKEETMYCFNLDFFKLLKD